MDMVIVIAETETATGRGMATETVIVETAIGTVTESATDTGDGTIIHGRDNTTMTLMKTLELKGGIRRPIFLP
jgi:hypothetical protein